MEEKKENIRFFIDLDIKGNAKGGVFIKCKSLKNKIESLEKDGKQKVVGVAYDGTNNLEIITIDSDKI